MNLQLDPALNETENADALQGQLEQHDLVRLLLADRRSENTRRAYAADLNDFFRFSFRSLPSPEYVRQFLNLPVSEMTMLLFRYKANLMERGLAEATVNRRLAAVKSLVRFARRIGLTDVVLEGRVVGERIRPYRDTTGIDGALARELVNSIDTTTLVGKRDVVLLLLLLENALRRAEIVALRVGDYEAEKGTLSITGKGRGTQKEIVRLSPRLQQALRDYLSASGHAESVTAPLFISLSNCHRGQALTADGVYKIVRARAKACGIRKPISPHRLRHTAITLALDLSQGDIRRVQRLSRHARLETLRIYDDNRQDLQGEISETLSRYLSEGESSKSV
ncbi:MAG TPA: tyrosine-type recombinase/integrase [Chthonomonas sp.]|uniref:tyrosine-type recombinase/integrase n=1 Tax=Chthonomonas sp. TaxID=2282153 RepID=UPI002B4B1571|nr:tyrosine-type recombinase/integrase [Chthonomonas sp.]HLI48837.1 tyrosine-type recombinase/integrase [Chthonomonas sp.]